jgi:hypothetical protein
VFQFPADKVVRQRIEQNPERRSLQPPGLSRRDPLRAHSAATAGLDEKPRRRALAERAVRSQDRHARSREGQDLPRPEAQLAARPDPPDIGDRQAVFSRETRQIRVIPGEFV